MVGRIRALGLEVALHKTEAVAFCPPRRRMPPQFHLSLDGVRVDVKSSIKYLGLHIDSQWDFREHFRRLGPRLREAVAGLGRLLPNLGGPKDARRRLYLTAVGSMALYGAPVFSEALSASPQNLRAVESAQRRLAIRVARAYSTVSYEAACCVAGAIPWPLLARMYASLYKECTRIRA